MNNLQLIGDRYRLDELISQGLMGSVYRGVDRQSETVVAIKVLQTEQFAQQEELLVLFEQEVKVLQQLNHPNIVHFSDFCTEPGVYFLVMEYVPGGPLFDLLQAGSLPLDRVLEIGLDVADALARAHRLGIIHRDVKPHNILLAADGTPRLSDFGLAHYVQRRSSALVPDPSGTIHYMPPEAFQNLPVDERTDIWSLGVVLFEMVTGRLPFDAATTSDLIQLITSSPLPDLSMERPETPAALWDLICLMLAKQPKDRLPSIRLVGATLEAIRNGRESMLPATSATGSSSVDIGNLPDPPTSFIGRKLALAELETLFAKPGGHLITLTGPGGVGKTRLALQLSRTLQDYSPDGVYFVDLATITASDLVASRITQTLGLREADGRSVTGELLAFLQQKNCLIILDNFEHVIQAAPLVGQLKKECPQLNLIVTSREALRLRGEQIYPVYPLTLPDLTNDRSPVALAAAEAVDLFVQRAAAAQPGFRLTANNAREIAGICIQLDGLPLAIELAAARTRILSPHYLLRELKSLFTTLATGPRDSVARQQTLRAAIDWSYELLDKGEKILLARLAIFAGGATLAAIEVICMPGLNMTVFNGLDSLVSKNLLLRRDDSGPEPRFGFLKTIEQYGRQRLKESDDAAIIQARHATFFFTQVETITPRLKGAEQEEYLGIIRAEYDNLRAVMNWSLGGNDLILGLQLTAALADFWYYEGSTADGKTWLDAALRWLNQAPLSLQIRLLNGASMLAFNRGDHRQGATWSQQALILAQEIDDEAGTAWSLFWLSAHTTGEPAEYVQGIAHCREALSLFRTIPDQYGLAWGYNQIGELSRLIGKYEQAEEAYQQAKDICRQTGNIRREAIALVNLGYVAQHQGKHAEAEIHILEGLALLYRLKLKHHSAIAMASLSGPLVAQGFARRAAKMLAASDVLFTRMALTQQPADQMEIENYLAQIHGQISDREFRAIWSEGQAMSFDEAVAYAFLKERPRDTIIAFAE